MDGDKSRILASVRDYYGRVLASTKDLKTSACTSSTPPHPRVRGILKLVPASVLERFYGCGSPVPLGIEGLHVLDLGSGSGVDCYVAAALVGPHGSVTGIDMTDEQLAVARAGVDEYAQRLGFKPNLRFVKGYIELLCDAGIEPSSMDVVISNCVVNLSPDKPAVLRGVHTVLKEGGEFYFSDVYANRRLPDSVRKHEVLFGECLGGALYIEDFRRLCQQMGFADPRVVSMVPIQVSDPELTDLVGDTQFYSITYRLFKLGSLEDKCEDYGQVATYLGTLDGNPHHFALDKMHVFVTGKPELVCGNTASMLSETRLRKHFVMQGDRARHFGLFQGCETTGVRIAVDNYHGLAKTAPKPSCCGGPDMAISGNGCC